MCDYIAKNLIYDEKQFCHHYLMMHFLLLQIVHFVNACDGYFMQQQNVYGTMGLFALQKCIITMRILAYGVAINALDE